MGRSIGLLELKSIPVGMLTADEIVKSADVELLQAIPTCPGKYVVIITGNVGPVKAAMETGIRTADTFLVSHHVINNVHDSVPAAISATGEVKNVAALGVIETISAVSAVMAGDIAAKAANINLIEIRIARGLGGKGFLVFSGEISAVRSAINACLNEMKDTAEIMSQVLISSPDKRLIDKVL